VLFHLPYADLVVETLRLATSVFSAVSSAVSTRFLKFLVFLDVFRFFHMRILALILIWKIVHTNHFFFCEHDGLE
jgi:hypothetical protein